MFLTREEIEHLTGRKRPSHQIRVLRQQGVPFRLRPKGSTLWPVVLRSAVEGNVAASYQPEPELRLPNGSQAQV